MTERREIAGPTGMSGADTRLAALRAHLAALEAAPAQEKEPSLAEALLPLVLAQGLDFLSTEKPLGFNRRSDTAEIANKFPGARSQGFAGTAGRIGSGLTELAVAAALTKLAPKVSKAFIAPAATIHTDYAKKNWQMMEDLALRDKRRDR